MAGVIAKFDSVAQALAQATTRLAGEESRAEAEMLLAAAIGRSRSWLYAHAGDALDAAQSGRFLEMIGRRERGEPVAQILGEREFWSLRLMVTADTLIPRPETELLVELALARLRDQPQTRVLDLGTGSGAIALALAHELPRAELTAIDFDARTLQVAKKNAARLGLGRISFLQGDWYSAVHGERYDMIVSNPPYIEAGDPHLSRGDLRFEPKAALVSGADGLDAIRAIIAGAPAQLRVGGHLLIEHGFDQAARVRDLLVAAGFVEVASHRDLESRDRVSGGRLPA